MRSAGSSMRGKSSGTRSSVMFASTAGAKRIIVRTARLA